MMRYLQVFLIASLTIFSSQSFYAQVDDAIVVYNNISSEFAKKDELKVKKKILIKINNSNGRDIGIVRQHYDAFKKIVKINAKILDENQKKVRNIKKSEIEDYATNSGFLHTDDRIKMLKIAHNTFPYYVQVEIELEIINLRRFPLWYPTYDYNVLCNQSTYSITAPRDYDINFKLYNFDAVVTKVVDDDKLVWSWVVRDISFFYKKELFSPPISECLPKGVFIPKIMNFEGRNYSLDSWVGIGHWSSDLIDGLDKLPQNEIDKVEKLTQNCDTDIEKIQKVYNYLQDETRYVGIFEGMGGWIPFDAEYVCTNKYGDCKALTNYMKAMLNEIDIKAYYTLVHAGSNYMDIDTSFVYDRFNHVILFIPLEKDTVWLECTSQYNPFGYLGSFTTGRHALVCDHEKSKLIKTPAFTHQQNSVELKADIHLENDHLYVESNRLLRGYTYDKFHSFIESRSEEDIRDFASENLDFSNYEIVDVNYKSIATGDPHLIEKAKLRLKGKTQTFANKIIVEPAPRILKPRNKTNSKRKNPIRIIRNYLEIDSLTYTFPENTKILSIPEDMFFENEFGSFTQKYISHSNVVLLVKKFKLNALLKSREYYPEFEILNAIINKAERQKILIEKNDEENE